MEAHAGTLRDDDDLVSALKAEDAGAFAEMVREYGPRMLAAIRRIVRDEALAQDCLQDAFLNVFRGIGTFDQRARLSSWLHRVAVNAALMRLRKLGRLKEASIDDLMPEFDGNDCRIEPTWRFEGSPESRLDAIKLKQQVRDNIDRLPESYRVVLLLRDIEELSTAEVAEALEITETNVKVRLHRARSALKKLLEPMWGHDD